MAEPVYTEPPDLSMLRDYGLNQTNPISELGQKENDLLAMVRQFDPNASWKFQDNSGSSNEGGSRAANTYVLDFDQSKFPDARPPGSAPRKEGDLRGVLGSSGELFGTTSLHDPDSYANNNLINPEYAWDSPYGRVTDTRNVKHDTGPADMVFKFAPMLIMALATMGAGAPALAGLSGAVTASGGTAFEAMLAQALPGILQNASNGSFNYGTLASILGQQAGLPSWANTALSTGTNLAINNGKKP